MVRFRLNEDLLAGLFFVGCGVFGLLLCRGLQVGTASSMGPAYMPMLLAWGMIGLGAAIAVKGLLTVGPLHPWVLRPLLIVLSSVLLFAVALPWAGLGISAFLTVVLAGFASREVRVPELLVLAAGSAVAVMGIFIYALGLPMKPWPTW